MSSYKKFIIALVAIFTAVAAALVIYLLTQPHSTNSQPNQQISLGGTLTCLPHKNSNGGPQTLECAIGLKADDNKYYALKNLPQAYVTTDKTVLVKGVTEANSQNNVYDIEATVSVQSVREK